MGRGVLWALFGVGILRAILHRVFHCHKYVNNKYSSCSKDKNHNLIKEILMNFNTILCLMKIV